MWNPLSSFGRSVTDQSWRWRWRREALHHFVLVFVHPSPLAATAVRRIFRIRPHHSPFLLEILRCSNDLNKTHRSISQSKQSKPIWWMNTFVAWHWWRNRWNYLAAERAEAEGIEEAALADFAGVGDAFAGPRLRPFVQEDDSSAVDNVGLNAGDVQNFLNLWYSYHIVVRRPSNLPQNRTRMEKQSNPVSDFDCWSEFVQK